MLPNPIYHIPMDSDEIVRRVSMVREKYDDIRMDRGSALIPSARNLSYAERSTLIRCWELIENVLNCSMAPVHQGEDFLGRGSSVPQNVIRDAYFMRMNIAQILGFPVAPTSSLVFAMPNDTEAKAIYLLAPEKRWQP